MNRSHIRVALMAIPLVICNLVAFTGQLSFIREHLHWPLIGDIGFAAGLESIAIYLAFMAHDALMAEDSSFKLRLGSYGAAFTAAALNYGHYAGPGLRPTFAAVGTAVMSSASPFLWGVFSRRQSRDQLMAKGLIERHSVRLGSARWLWHPWRSVRVMWVATWAGIQSPAAAIAAAGLQFTPPASAAPEPVADAAEHLAILAAAPTDAARVRHAMDVTGGTTARQIADWLKSAGFPVHIDNVRSVMARVARGGSAAGTATVTHLNSRSASFGEFHGNSGNPGNSSLNSRNPGNPGGN